MKELAALCSIDIHLIWITNTTVTYVSLMSDILRRVSERLQFTSFQHYLLLPVLSGAVRISSSGSMQIHWSHRKWGVLHFLINSQITELKPFFLPSFSSPPVFLWKLLPSFASFGHQRGQEEKQNHALPGSFHVFNFPLPPLPGVSKEKSAPSLLRAWCADQQHWCPQSTCETCRTQDMPRSLPPQNATACSFMDFWSGYCFPNHPITDPALCFIPMLLFCWIWQYPMK